MSFAKFEGKITDLRRKEQKKVFKNPLKFRLLEDGRSAELLYDFKAVIPPAQSYQVFVVKAGFKTDFASVPRSLWWLVPPWGRYSPAAVLHDFLYFEGRISRRQADRIFLTLMERLQVAGWRRRLMYTAVRLFGWKTWRSRRKIANF